MLMLRNEEIKEVWEKHFETLKSVELWGVFEEVSGGVKVNAGQREVQGLRHKGQQINQS